MAVLDTRGDKLQQYLNKMIASFGLSDTAKLQDENLPMLSERENEVVKLLVKGYTNQEIAAELYISEVTVKKHLTAVFQKLNVRNRTQLDIEFSKDGNPGYPVPHYSIHAYFITDDAQQQIH